MGKAHYLKRICHICKSAPFQVKHGLYLLDYREAFAFYSLSSALYEIVRIALNPPTSNVYSVNVGSYRVYQVLCVATL